MSFAKEAWPFVLPFCVGAIALFALGRPRWALATFAVGFAVLLFFRIPNRHFEGEPAILLSPASGHITSIESIVDDDIPGRSSTRIVTFLSVFDVHVQRSPAPGKVVSSVYREGRKIAAFKPEAGEVNQSQTTVLELENGDLVAIRQLAGLVARRVVGYLDKGDVVSRGELMGVIKFGSRVDLLIPAEYRVLVEVGQRVHEGLTPMASSTLEKAR